MVEFEVTYFKLNFWYTITFDTAALKPAWQAPWRWYPQCSEKKYIFKPVGTLKCKMRFLKFSWYRSKNIQDVDPLIVFWLNAADNLCILFSTQPTILPDPLNGNKSSQNYRISQNCRTLIILLILLITFKLDIFFGLSRFITLNPLFKT